VSVEAGISDFWSGFGPGRQPAGQRGKHENSRFPPWRRRTGRWKTPWGGQKGVTEMQRHVHNLHFLPTNKKGKEEAPHLFPNMVWVLPWMLLFLRSFLFLIAL